MAEILSVIAQWIMAFLMNVGLLGVFLALAIREACIPITSEVFSFSADFWSPKGSLACSRQALQGRPVLRWAHSFPITSAAGTGRRSSAREAVSSSPLRESSIESKSGLSATGTAPSSRGARFPSYAALSLCRPGTRACLFSVFFAYTALGSFPLDFRDYLGGDAPRGRMVELSRGVGEGQSDDLGAHRRDGDRVFCPPIPAQATYGPVRRWFDLTIRFFAVLLAIWGRESGERDEFSRSKPRLARPQELLASEICKGRKEPFISLEECEFHVQVSVDGR